VGHPIGPIRRVLVVARWYPAYDDPGRGAFVGDHVCALVEAGVAVTVASFEPAFARGKPDSRPERIRVALDAWSIAVTRPDATNVPRSWGVPGVPVARLPVVLDPADRSPLTEVSAHAAALVPFGIALAARDGIDIIHAHTAIPDGLAGAHLAAALGIPLVVTEHDSTLRARLDDPDVAALYGTLPGPRRRIVAVSDRLAALLGVRVGIPREAIAVIPNPIPIDVFTGDASGPEGRRDPDELLYVGGRTDAKGMDVLLRAFAAVRERRPTLRLRCVGRAPTPEDDERWRELSAELGVVGAVELGPPADRRGVADAMRHAGLLVLASPYETFGMVVAEALACGLPVAATRSGVEAILGEDGTFGEVAAGTDAASLADAIDRALARLGAFDPRALRERVLHDFSGPAIADRTLALYAEVEVEGPADGGAAATPPRMAAGPRTPAARPAGPRVRPLLVAFNRTVALRSVPRLPAAVAERAVVVTVPPTPQAPGPVPAIGTWIEYDPVAEYKARLADLTTASDAGAFTRLRAATTAPARHRERDDLVRDREAWIEDAGHRTFRRAREAATADGDLARVAVATDHVDLAWVAVATDHVDLAWVAVEADDVTAGRALSEEGIALAPGTLRWLADREDQAPIAAAPGAEPLIATTTTVEETP
jgi:glycosyltransferase involved in cell wall biosynthesis